MPTSRAVGWVNVAAPMPFAPSHVSAFFEPLSHHGSWHRAGHAWRWRSSDRLFAPFIRGRWVLTEYGPTWVSATPYGWAVEHYGEWYHDEGGWAWQPSTRWSPAQVDWRKAARVIGWAPRMAPDDSASDPAALWRFAGNDAFFAALRPSRAPGDALATLPLEDPRYNAFYLAHSRALGDWRQTPRGELVAVGAETRPIQSLDAAATRWQPAWAREAVASRLLPAPRGTRTKGAEAPRRERAPLVQTPGLRHPAESP